MWVQSRIGQFEWLPKRMQDNRFAAQKGSCGRASPFVACSPAHASSHPHLPTQRRPVNLTQNQGGRRAESPELHVSPGLPGLPGVLETFLCYRVIGACTKNHARDKQQRKKKQLFLPVTKAPGPFEARPNKIIPNLAKPSIRIDLSIPVGVSIDMSPVLTPSMCHNKLGTWFFTQVGIND